MDIAFLEDDEEFASCIVNWLQNEGYTVTCFSNGRDLIRSYSAADFDMLLLDWSLSDIDGIEVMNYIRLRGNMPPVLFLTMNDAEEDIVRAIDSGADDYIVKPPVRSVLLARIRALLRRCGLLDEPSESFGHIQVDFDGRRFNVDGVEASLTAKETELALYFFSRIGILNPRAHIIRAVWGGSEEINTRTVDVHISRLRRKLELMPERGWRLSSVYCQGYRLERVEIE